MLAVGIPGIVYSARAYHHIIGKFVYIPFPAARFGRTPAQQQYSIYATAVNLRF